MKIFILAAKENWITDQLESEWIQNNREKYTTNIHEADIIWVLSNYIVKHIPHHILMNKKVITTIHHIVPEKMTIDKVNHFKYLDQVSTCFHTNNRICHQYLQNCMTKPVILKPLWTNQNTWKVVNDKKSLNQQFNLPNDTYLIGSFQRDTEGNSIHNNTYMPKLEKGPDIFLEVIKLKLKSNPDLEVVLSGNRRHYLIRELKKLKVKVHYFEMLSLENINLLYQCLDLYIVSSRYEGGPRAINECAANKTPIISTDVGIASDILAPESIYSYQNLESIINSVPNVEYAFNTVSQQFIPEYFEKFNKIFN
jgi:glycosyltransferase involved in cell wall biosynthesis